MRGLPEICTRMHALRAGRSSRMRPFSMDVCRAVWRFALCYGSSRAYSDVVNIVLLILNMSCRSEMRHRDAAHRCCFRFFYNGASEEVSLIHFVHMLWRADSSIVVAACKLTVRTPYRLLAGRVSPSRKKLRLYTDRTHGRLRDNRIALVFPRLRRDTVVASGSLSRNASRYKS